MFKRKPTLMQEIQKRDRDELRNIDIRSCFIPGYIPDRKAKPAAVGVHGWYDADGELVLFGSSEGEVTPESIDAALES